MLLGTVRMGCTLESLCTQGVEGAKIQIFGEEWRAKNYFFSSSNKKNHHGVAQGWEGGAPLT